MLEMLFKYLGQTEIAYCVVGRTDCLPDEIVGDVDIVIDARSSKDFYHYLFEFSCKNRLKLVQVLKHESTANYFVIAWMGLDGKPKFLHLDVCTDYYRNGRAFLTAEEILSARTPALDIAGKPKGFFTATPAKEFIYYVLKKVDKQSLSDEHGTFLSRVWAKSPVACEKDIGRFWSKENAELLRRASGENEWQAVRQKMPDLKRDLHSRLLPKSLESSRREFWRKLRRIMLHTGLHVAFLGPDGSGKSSVIDRITADLAPAFRKVAYIHLRPNIGRRNSQVKPEIDTYILQSRSLPASVAKIIYLLFDYSIGWWLFVWPKAIRSTLIVFDRYYHDLLVDPLRYRYGGPMWLARWIGKLIPKPDLWILLDAPAGVLQARKQEVPFEESARQRDAYLGFVKNIRNGVVIDAAQPFEKVVTAVNVAILDFMATRTRKRFG